MSEKLYCICCDKEMHNYIDKGYQPSEGLAFSTSGHYGSTYFDPMDDTWIALCVCDTCIEAADKKGRVFHGPWKAPT